MARSFLNIPGYPLGLRNNNPGNIRTGDNWQGMTGSNRGFVVFEDIIYGLRALGIDLRTKINNGYDTIEKLISRYAPTSENDTTAYIVAVERYSGISFFETLSADPVTLRKLMRAIMNVELGPNYSALISNTEINQGIDAMGGNFPVGEVGFGFSVLLFAFAVYLFSTMPKIKHA